MARSERQGGCLEGIPGLEREEQVELGEFDIIEGFGLSDNHFSILIIDSNYFI